MHFFLSLKGLERLLLQTLQHQDRSPPLPAGIREENKPKGSQHFLLQTQAPSAEENQDLISSG